MDTARLDLQTSETLLAPSESGVRCAARGALPSVPRPSALAGPSQPERFTFVAPLGAGGEGEVWRARDHDIGRDVAIKRARGADPRRLAMEARVAGALEHPGIVPIHDVGVDETGHAYVVMRCIDGDSLERIIERLAAGDPEAHAVYCFERRMTIFRRLCEAVAYAHAHGIIHGDIKPANVLVGRFGEVFLTDWGIARRSGDGASNVVAGTPTYMPPEQARGAALDARSDVFALCATLFELLTLRTWIDGPSVADVLARIGTTRAMHPTDVPSPHQPRVPMDLGWFVLGGLAADPASRYSSVDAMLSRLDQRAEGRVPIQCTQTALKRVLYEGVRSIERHPHLLPLGIGIGVVLTALALLR